MTITFCLFYMSRYNRDMARSKKPIARHFNAPKTCSGKNRYPTRLDAEQVIAEKAIMQPELELTLYRCAQCRDWHLTRSKKEPTL